MTLDAASIRSGERATFMKVKLFLGFESPRRTKG